MRTITQSYTIHAPRHLVWRALVEPELIEAWGGGPVIMNDHEGSAFSMWGGSVHGTNTHIVDDELLEQDWYSGDDWPHASKVTIELEDEDDGTLVTLTQHDVPASEIDDVDDGWHEYFFGPLQKLVESKAHH